MLIDKKREEMYYNCRMRKKSIDKKIAVIRAVLVIPPLLIFAFTVVDILMSMVGEAAILATGAGLYGYEVVGTSFLYMLDLVCCAALAAIGIGIVFLEADFMVKKGVALYAALAGLFLILLLVSGYIPVLTYFILALIGIPFTLWAKGLIAEDKKMSALDGYPHFNTTLMKHTDVPFTPPSQEEIDGMSPDERIMYEREH